MMKFFIYISLMLTARAFDDDVFKDAKQLIEKYGYPFEKHDVQTDDGYILGVHRIRHGLNNAGQSGKKVVLIMHQFLSSSADFVNMGDRSLAFLLADRNYDVWLGNARGNTYSRKHASLNPDDVDSGFWSFDWEDIGIKDLPQTIDFIISETKTDQIYYIGHGQGCTIFYVMASTMPEYNAKVKMMAALAPMAYMEAMPNPLFRVMGTLLGGLGSLKSLVQELVKFLEGLLGTKMVELLRLDSSGTFVYLCDDDTLFVEVCAGFISLIYGFDSAQLERNKIPVILSNAYAGGSYEQLLKYLDFYYKDTFGKTYNLTSVAVPTGIFYGRNDWLISKKDIDHLAEDLQNVVLKYEVPYKDFNHIDFLFAKDVKELVYDRLFELFDSGTENKRKEL